MGSPRGGSPRKRTFPAEESPLHGYRDRASTHARRHAFRIPRVSVLVRDTSNGRRKMKHGELMRATVFSYWTGIARARHAPFG